MATKAKSAQARVRKLTPKQARTKAKKEVSSQTKLPSSFKLVTQCLSIFRRFWKPFAGVLLIYLILNIIFASGISSINSTVDSVKADLQNTSTNAHPLLSGVTGFLVLVSSAGTSSSSSGSLLQFMLIFVESLVIIWMLRQLLADKKVTVKQAYYSSITPAIPFLLVLGVALIQLLPITFGSSLLSSIASALGNISGFWTIVFSLIFGLLAAWSVFMLSSSIFALYIVTLPGMQPRQALRSAKNLVRFRRWPVIRKVLFLPVLLLLVFAAVIIPLTLYATFLVAPVFYILGALTLLFVHSYLYSLYRSLLG